MKWRISFNWKPKGEDAFGVAFLVSLVWFLTTLAFHCLALRTFDLPNDAGYRDGDEDMMSAYLLPLVCGMPLWITLTALCIENSWRRALFLRARLICCAFSALLLLWCWWSLQTSLSYGYQNRFHGYRITDTVQAAAYAAIAFPFTVACACLLLAFLRRADASDSLLNCG